MIVMKIGFTVIVSISITIVGIVAFFGDILRTELKAELRQTHRRPPE